MSVRQYDIAVIGCTLSARIAAALLAKSGQRVLFVRQREATAPTWFHSSLFLQNLLDLLGGRSCFAASQPFQVLAEEARITLHPDVALEGELQRELGPASTDALLILSTLHRLGKQLENVLWQNGGLPWPSVAGRTRFKLLCARRKLKTERLHTPVNALLKNLTDPARQLLRDLFQGLALAPIDQISQGEAAMLWTQVMGSEHLKEPDFSQLLSKRFEQFHGAKDDLEQLADLQREGRRWTGGRFKEGGRFTATTFLLGDRRWLEHFAPLSTSLPVADHSFQLPLGDLTGQLSPLLEARVVCGGPTPLRLTISTQNERTYGQIDGYGRFDPNQLHEQLEPVLPFARYQFPPPTSETDGSVVHPICPVLGNQPLKLADNLYLADSTTLFPGLGAAGAALLGWTLYRKLSGKTGQHDKGSRWEN